MIVKYGYWMRLVLILDMTLNVVTGGELGVCFSTRVYLNSADSDMWFKIMLLIDKVFWEGHCRDSYLWEIECKRSWIEFYKGK